LGLIHQPIGLLNVNKFFNPLLDQMRLMQDEGFLRPGSIELIKVEVTAERLLGRMESSY
jgi:predicted Rossmann-fold nucleotide-binding protein